MKRFQQYISMNKQRGAALLIFAMILILTVTLVMVGRTSRNADKLQREENIYKRLADAKEAMIAIAVSNNTLPGVLLYPDRNNDGDFNGLEDCNGGNNPQTNLNLLMGRLPFLGAGADGNCTAPVPTSLDIGQTLNLNEDARPLHYVISQNLAEFNTTLNSINSNVISEPDIPGAPTGWLTVYDGNGNLLSSQVAFIIFYPGTALTTASGYVQNRSGATPGPAEYLDSATVTVTLPTPGTITIDNAVATTGIYVTASESVTFNDKLVFVTATELMRRVEQGMLNRIAVQLSASFNSAPFPVDQATLIAAAPYNAAPFSYWLDTALNNAYDDIRDPTPNNGYGSSVTYSTTVLTCNGVTFTGATVTGIAALGNQCAGAN